MTVVNNQGAGKKAPRRLERTFAFKVLYGLLFTSNPGEAELARAFELSPDRPAKLDGRNSYAWCLCQGVWKERESLDAAIVRLSQNWRLERMGKVEATLLRIALFEMKQENPEVPPKVAINEALELSRQFGDERSRGFVNGVLDAAIKALEGGSLFSSEHSEPDGGTRQ